MPEALTWEICDLSQNVLSRLDSRNPGAKISIPNNGARRATVTIDPAEPELAAGLAGSAAAGTGLPMLDRVLRARIVNHPPHFCGRIMAPDVKRQGADRLVTLNAFDPWTASLDRSFIHEIVGPQLRYKQFGPVDQTAMIREMIAYPFAAPAGAFVARGIYATDLSDGTRFPTSFNRTRSYAVGTPLGAAITELANLDFGPDVELRPLTDAANPTALCELVTHYPKRGTDKSESVVFEYGHGRQSATEADVVPADDPCNYFIAIGASPTGAGDWRIACIAQHAGSIAAFGQLADFEDRSETTDRATLRNYAAAQVAERQNPVAFFSFTQAPQWIASPPIPTTDDPQGSPPSFGLDADYYIGDTIALRIQPDGTDDASLQQTLIGRVTDAEITELESGQVVVRCDCSPELDSASVTLTNYGAYLPDLSTL